jgi:tetratricopeptide (TPR) repeat protein
MQRDSARPATEERGTPRSPEDHLLRAMKARSVVARARWARKGLAAATPLDPTTHAMLLRQLYLALYERGDFRGALEVALQAVETGVMTDVVRQDAARAATACGDFDAAVVHLRVAARSAPPSRRAFHLWTLGSLLFLAAQYDAAETALTRAVRWGTHGKPLYRAHLALVRMAAGRGVEDIQSVIDELATAPCGQGYGRFVLGHLAYAAGAWPAARRYLEAFVRRTEGERTLEFSLAGELAMARATLAKMACS